MPDAPSPLSWNTVFRPLGEKMSAQLAGALTDLRLSEEAQGRYEELASKNTEGALNEVERVELEEFVTLNRMVGILKAEALLALRGKAAA
jgi:hypothetical protein